MVAVALAMLRPRKAEGDASVRISPAIAARLVGIGLLTGALAGFFGIGGGFLIVPGIVLGSGMAMLNAVGSSLFSVGAFGLTTAVNYAQDGLIDWRVAGLFIAGGLAGGVAGTRISGLLAARKGLLNRLFALLIEVVNGELVAGIRQVSGHGRAHGADADEADFADGSIHMTGPIRLTASENR